MPELSSGKARYDYLVSQRKNKDDMAQQQARQIMEGLIKGDIEKTTNPSEATITQNVPRAPQGMGEKIGSFLGIQPQGEEMYKSTGAKDLDTKLKKAQIGYLTGDNGSSTSPARSQEEALSRIPQGDNPKDYKVTEKTVMVKGMPVSTWVAEPDPKLQESRVKGEEESQFIKDTAQDTLNTIGEIEKGISYFGTFGQLPSIPGTQRTVWEANVNKLLSGKIVELITKMKSASKTGATGFGQLSDREGQILREASTALKRGLPPQESQKILNTMKEKLQKVVSGDNTQVNQPSKYIKTGIDKDTGQKVGQLADGTIEVIQ